MECTRYYQNVRGLTTNSFEFMSEIAVNSHTVLLFFCLTEICLVDSIPSCQYFIPCYSVYLKYCYYVSTRQRYRGGVLTAGDIFLFALRTYYNNCESHSEGVWIRVTSCDGLKYLIRNYYFRPHTDSEVVHVI